ncbi:MAG: glucose 1-dehydrogenase [Frankiaceae bacterium]|nr:glucose 1-dehydrogenase [Frankiaceae bacterium]
MGEPSAPVALVTGTSRGIGTAIARRLLAEGFTVVGLSRSGSLDLADPHFHDVRLDLANDAECNRVLPRALDMAGRVDLLVNNAGGHVSAPCWELPAEAFDALLRLNLTVPFLLCQQVLRHWIDSERTGSIVNLCSIESEVAWADPPQAAYAMTKGGMAGLTRALAYDFGAHGIRVNGVAPGAVDTEMSPSVDDALAARIPLRGRLGTVDEVAGAVAYLASPAASYVTGEILYVDGGYRLP